MFYDQSLYPLSLCSVGMLSTGAGNASCRHCRASGESVALPQRNKHPLPGGQLCSLLLCCPKSNGHQSAWYNTRGDGDHRRHDRSDRPMEQPSHLSWQEHKEGTEVLMNASSETWHLGRSTGRRRDSPGETCSTTMEVVLVFLIKEALFMLATGSISLRTAWDGGRLERCAPF